MSKLLKLFFIFIFTSTFAQSDFDNAEKLFNQKKYAEAQELFENYLKQKPNDLKTIEYLGDCAGYQKKWDDAIKRYQTLKTISPKNANYWYKYGGALGFKMQTVNKLKALSMIDDVENALLTAAKLDPKNTDSRWALVTFYIQLPGIVGGSENKAQKYANQLLEISPVDGYLSKGYIDEYFNRNLKAETNYKKAFEIGHSKTTFFKLYNLYLNKLKQPEIAKKLKEEFNK